MPVTLSVWLVVHCGVEYLSISFIRILQTSVELAAVYFYADGSEQFTTVTNRHENNQRILARSEKIYFHYSPSDPA
jgi:hypothetical protein